LNVHDITNLTVGASYIYARGAGDGAGGSVILDSQSLVDGSEMEISARGGTTGNGGYAEISNFTVGGVGASIDDAIDVLSGNLEDDADSGTPAIAHPVASPRVPSSNGKTKLNGLNCSIYALVGYLQWPNYYHLCTSTAATPSGVDNAVESAFTNSMLNTIRSSFMKTQVYVFDNIGVYNSYQRNKDGFQTAPTGTGGVTWYGGDRAGNVVYLNVMENGTNGLQTSVPYTATTIPEIAGHEIGHVYDITKASNPSDMTTYPSVQTSYQTTGLTDLEFLDYVINTSTLAITPRNPCTTTIVPGTSTVAPPGIAPFSGVVDKNGISVCNGTALSSTYATNYSTNSSLLISLDNSFLPTVNTGGVQWWPELHAQAFGVNLGNFMARPVYDQLFTNKYFGCALAVASTEQGTSSGCTYPLSANYHPFQ
jgi:hypothetical protein